MGISPKTLPQWRIEGRSPPWVKLGKKIVYRRMDIERFLSDRVRVR